LKQHELFVFNIFDIDAFAYVEKSEACELCQKLELSEVPLLGQMQIPDSLDELIQSAEGKSVLNDSAEREGMVWVHGSGRERISFKVISNRFLAKEK